jgi:glycosyltransferase involved in cell wall biosynthesis
LPPGFEDQAAKELREGSVVIHRGLSRGELEQLLSASAALLYLSRSEGFGMPALEAMACGVPVVTGLAPSTREVGADAALYVDPGHPVGSAAALVQRVMTDPDFRAQTVAAGRRRAREHSWERVAERYVALYADAAG